MAVAPVPALFSPSGEGFAAAPLTAGPWDERMMHGGPPAALLAHAIERVQPGDDLVVTRLTVDFFGGVPLGEVSVQASLAKSGRRFQIVDATLDAGGPRACLARAVRLRRADLPAAAAAPDVSPLPPPDAGETLAPFVVSDRAGFYPDATEIRQVGGRLGSGHAAAWIRLRGELLPDVPASQLVRATAAADFANGLSWTLPIDEWLYINTELTIHLHREPQGTWIGLEARTAIGPSGIGLSSGVLHDLGGPFGTCAQSLFVERR